MMKVMCILVMSLMMVGCYTISDGEKMGIITKFSKSGFLFKTYEAELIRGGLTSGSGVFGQSFDFTISDPAMAETVKIAMEQQKEIKIKYHQEWLVAPWRGATQYFLDSVEIIEKS